MSITVAFHDQSTAGPSGPITAWSWDFGEPARTGPQPFSQTISV